MECAVCGEPAVGYWCSEEHHQKWYAENAHSAPRSLPRMPNAAVLWGAFARDQQEPEAQSA
jgi:hypothetical protein